MKASTATCDASPDGVLTKHEQCTEASDMWELDHISDMWSIDVDTCNTENAAEFEQLVHQRSTSARETQDLADQLQRLQAEAQVEVIRRQSTRADRTRELAQVWQTAASTRGLSHSTTIQFD